MPNFLKFEKTSPLFWQFSFLSFNIFAKFHAYLYIHNYSHDLCCTVLYGYSCYMGKILPLQNLAADIAPIWNILGTTPSLRHFSILAEVSKCGFLSVKQHQINQVESFKFQPHTFCGIQHFQMGGMYLPVAPVIVRVSVQ